MKQGRQVGARRQCSSIRYEVNNAGRIAGRVGAARMRWSEAEAGRKRTAASCAPSATPIEGGTSEIQLTDDARNIFGSSDRMRSKTLQLCTIKTADGLKDAQRLFLSEMPRQPPVHCSPRTDMNKHATIGPHARLLSRQFGRDC